MDSLNIIKSPWKVLQKSWNKRSSNLYEPWIWVLGFEVQNRWIEIDILFISPTCSNNWIVGEGHCHIQLTIYIHSLKFISYKVINSSGMTMLMSWKLDPYTVMTLNSGRRGNDVLKGGHLACSFQNTHLGIGKPTNGWDLYASSTDKECRIHCLESGIQDCLGFLYMVQEVHSNDHWVISKMADHPSFILRSSPLSMMACETTFPPWRNFLGSFFVLGILLKNLRWLICIFQMKTIYFFKVENFYQLQASTALYWTINHCNWCKLSFYLLKTFYC